MKNFRELLGDNRGIAAIEFGMIAGLIVIGILGTVTGLGQGVQSSYQDTAQKVADATP